MYRKIRLVVVRGGALGVRCRESKVTNFQLLDKISSEDIMYSMMTLVNSTVLYI